MKLCGCRRANKPIYGLFSKHHYKKNFPDIIIRDFSLFFNRSWQKMSQNSGRPGRRPMRDAARAAGLYCWPVGC